MMMVRHVPVRGRMQAMNHDTRRSREEATGTPTARQIGAVPSVILTEGASIIVIALNSSPVKRSVEVAVHLTYKATHGLISVDPEGRR
jgi:hypothetical protein